MTVHCVRCRKDIRIEEQTPEACAWCGADLCVDCWEKHGTCGKQHLPGGA